MSRYSVVGHNLPRKDAALKAKGEARYTDDLVLPRMLYGRILRSEIPHGRILHINLEKARRHPGVKGVLVGEEAPIPFGIVPQTANEFALAVGKVRYVGEGVAAVAAIDEETAEEALQLVDVEYEELPAVYDPIEAMRREDIRVHDRAKQNIDCEGEQNFGDVERAFRDSDLIREDTFRTQMVNHAFLEPHSALALFESPGRMTLWSSTQIPHYLQRTVAHVLSMPVSHVRVIKPFVGGGFGGKGEILASELVACLLSKKTDRPVKVTFSREEVFSTHRGRHPTIIQMKTGVKKDGTLMAMDIDLALDGGAYSGWGIVVMYYMASLFHAPYRISNLHFKGRRIFTNKPVMGAQRGLGGVQPRFAVESQLDMIAHDLGLDPVELRLKNAMYEGYQTANELQISTCGFSECLKRAAEKAGWKEKWGKLPKGRGIGIAGGYYVSGTGYALYRSDRPHSTAEIRVDPDGRITLFTGAADIGQGSDTVLAMMAAEELGVRVEEIEVVSGDTGIAPMDLGSFSSRVTLAAGNAVRKAAQDVKAQLFEIVSEKMKVDLECLKAKDHRIQHRENPEIGMDWVEAVEATTTQKGSIVGRGSFRPPQLGGKFKGGKIGQSPAYSFSAQIAEVEVDLKTGKVRVLEVTEASDCGFAINPMSVEGQVEGSIQMGMGQALFEEMVVDDRGKIVNDSFLDYKIPTSMDMPRINTLIVESLDPAGPFGAKEAGEGPIQPTIPAILNAIYNAVGVRIEELPVTPEKVLKGLQEFQGENRT
jgi:4-hydroxybenzoyl-CoA reductase alpha subunit